MSTPGTTTRSRGRRRAIICTTAVRLGAQRRAGRQDLTHELHPPANAASARSALAKQPGTARTQEVDAPAVGSETSTCNRAHEPHQLRSGRNRGSKLVSEREEEGADMRLATGHGATRTTRT